MAYFLRHSTVRSCCQPTRADAPFFMSTRTSFRRKSPGKRKKEADGASALKGRDRRYEEWKQYTDVLNPKVVRPNSVYKRVSTELGLGTPEELEEAREMTLMWKRHLMQREKTFRREEQQRIRLKMLAMEEVPEHLREDAFKVDESPLPENFIVTRLGEPLEGEELFGEVHVPGHKDALDYDIGAKPYLDRVRKHPYM